MSLEAQTSHAPFQEYFRCEVQPERSAARIFALGSLDVSTAVSYTHLTLPTTPYV